MIHSWLGIGVLAGCYNLPLHNPQATIRSADELLTLASTVTDVVVDNGVNSASCIILNISELKCMKHFRVGDWCFGKVRELRLTGLTELKSVEIGKHSFVRSLHVCDPNRRFYLKNCPKLKELKIGAYSFSDYSLCVITNCALKVIEMEKYNEWSYSFYHASLQLKGLLVTQES